MAAVHLVQTFGVRLIQRAQICRLIKVSIEPEPAFDRLELEIVLVVAAFDILAEGVNKVRKVLDLVLSEHI